VKGAGRGREKESYRKPSFAAARRKKLGGVRVPACFGPGFSRSEGERNRKEKKKKNRHFLMEPGEGDERKNDLCQEPDVLELVFTTNL